MLKLKNNLKKVVAAVIATLAIALLAITPVKSAATASNSETYLKFIMQYTYETDQAAYLIEQYILDMLVILNNWILPDTTPTTAALQSSFAQAASTAITNFSSQATLQQRLMQDFYGSNVTVNSVPYANDMTYSTLLGQPFYTKDPRDPQVDGAYNYLKNVAGLNIQHVVPNMQWKGSTDNKTKYQDFYTTVSAIQTYNSYVLSQLYLNKSGGKNSPPTLSAQQNQLVQQASSSDWFTQVASESMGVVMRQILMYNSQLYVLMTQQLQTEQQMLAALAMTNTLIVIGDQFTENQLLSKATGTAPPGS